MSEQQTPPAPTPHTYRLAPAIALRLTGVALVLTALLTLATLLVVALTPVPGWVVGVVAAVGVVVSAVLAWWLFARAWVVRVDEAGYRVGVVRGVGERAATWQEVERVSTSTPQGVAVLGLHLQDGRTTRIPVAALAYDRELFVTEMITRLGRR
ncbi:hypothetical protein [Nocardioides bruguierae]|uniref:PH domain-containing protein n=1 Tax=Nocardioides bruguierae TaxID=2945102 RepID=A0A9X2D882_9ACTN|nr:hypothetical protein [Nocardioides bruguierae]MCM0621108.1 hypothetical protein [Nocardioides bruguierae]